MFITTENEIISLMPTARWNRPDQLKGYLEEEERVALEPLLGTSLYEFLCAEYERLRNTYVDITATTVTPTRKARHDPGVAYADVTKRLDAIEAHARPCQEPYIPAEEDTDDVPEEDMQTIRLIRICQQVEFYRMLAHKAGLLTVSFNEGGGMNVVSADGYEEAGDKRVEHVVKDAFMSAGRAVDSLLLFLEADARGARLFTDKWSEADAFYLHKDLLFQTARVMKEFLGTRIDRMTYADLVHDIRYCQNTYLMPRVGAGLLRTVVAYANGGADDHPGSEVWDELLTLLRTALAFFVEGRRTELGPKGERLARRDSMTDAMQAMATACEFIAGNLDALGDAAVGTPVYNEVRRKEETAARDARHADAARRRMCRGADGQGRSKLFTAFPATHRNPELK